MNHPTTKPTSPTIAIVGVGGVFPAPTGSATPAQMWSLVAEGRTALREVPTGRWQIPAEEAYDPEIAKLDHVYSKTACFVDPIVPTLHDTTLSLDFVEKLDPLFHLTLEAGTSAFRNAKTASLDRQRVGVILGNIALPTEKASQLAREYLGRTMGEKFLGRGLQPPTESLAWHRHVAGLPAGLLAQALELGGGTFTLDAACASSLYAVKLAADELRVGRTDAMLAGGVSRPDCLYTQMGFSQLRALSPTGLASPFDSKANGLVVGEGAGIFVLKRLDDALRDGDTIWAVLTGVGLSNDIGGGLLAPNSEGQLRAMRTAYSDAAWAPEMVDYIECHATGTPLGDAVEFRSLCELWAGRPTSESRCTLGSVKANVGHLLTGAGAAGLARVLYAMREQTLPPTANFETPLGDIDLKASPFQVLDKVTPWQRRDEATPRRAAISGFGFGGINAHLLLEEHRESGSWSPPVVPREEVPIAIVGIDAKFGPWQSLDAVRRRLFGGDNAEPCSASRWWGAMQSEWFCSLGLDVKGHFVEELAIPQGRFRIPPRELEEMLPQQLLMLQTSAELLEELALTDETRQRTGVLIGLELDLNTTNFHFRWALSGLLDDWLDALGLAPEDGERRRLLAELRASAGPALNANRTMGALGSIVASRIAREYRLGGPSFTIAAEENSGLRALQTAMRALQQNELDLALVGAVDLVGDVRNVLGLAEERSLPTVGEGATAGLLKRLDDATRDGDTIHGVLRTDTARSTEIGFAPTSKLGYTGSASGLMSVVEACLALEQRRLPGPDLRYWLHDGETGPRRVLVESPSADGNFVRMVLEESPTPSPTPTFGVRSEALFVCEGDNVEALGRRLQTLDTFLADTSGEIETLARNWLETHPLDATHTLAAAFVVRDRNEFVEQLAVVGKLLLADPAKELVEESLPPVWRDRIFFTPQPLGPNAEVAFVYPGSGNDFPKMGVDLASAWPGVLRQQESENALLRSQYVADAIWDAKGEPTVCDRIQAQVALGTLVTDTLHSLGVRPDAAIGYSLGESAALFALRAWQDRDAMLQALHASTLFYEDLTGEYRAARQAWNFPDGQPLPWRAGIVAADAERVREAIAHEPRAYLLLINAPKECVVGGDADSVERVAERLGCSLMPVADPTSVHCPVVRTVADAYRELHSLPVTPTDVRVYSAALGHAYEVTQDSAAEAILAQALDTVDFRSVIENAYEDGVRIFVEIGPGASCSRMIAATLTGRPHRVRSACVAGVDGVSSILRILARLIVERIDVDLLSLYPVIQEEQQSPTQSLILPVGREPFEVSPMAVEIVPERKLSPEATPVAVAEVSTTLWGSSGPIQASLEQTLVTQQARGEAHSAYLRFASALRGNVEETLMLQQELLQTMVVAKKGTHLFSDPFQSIHIVSNEDGSEKRCVPFFAREQCLEFGIGSIANVLGSEFAEVDAYPTRVRLPDEPLMLVDRILSVEGEPRSMTSGCVITEHDVLPGAWYLDGGCIPTCIAVEAGQADLFLSGYLGIDFQTRGLAVYRLLDAVVTFHRSLPVAGETIHYVIHIDNFFRQGETYLFRFRFEGTVNGEPLLTMTKGCAGFFTEEELSSGRGVVQTELDRRKVAGVEPDETLVPLDEVETYDEAQIDALRRGDLESAFGPRFAGKSLGEGMRLPSGKMRLVHRVRELDRRGGRFGIGQIRGEADILPDDWFLTCHFIDDQVMPGTLMYECCLHTLRIFLLRIGWIGEGDERCEPVPGVASQLKCRGQVIATTKMVTYEITLKERGYRPEPYVICDALMYADGKPIVEITDMSLRIVGSSRDKLTSLWQTHQSSHALFDRNRITAFAIGKPSEAFGEPYRIFDEERVIARLPGPPYQFLDRITKIDAEPWKLVAGGTIEAEYDIPPKEWYFEADRQRVMPFAVLLEVALQPCGWLAAYLGSALTSPTDLCFRNLGGDAVLTRPIRPEDGTLTTSVQITDVSSSAGMILQKFRFTMRNRDEVVYRGTTSFGFFSREALAQQVGIRDGKPYVPSVSERSRGQHFAYPVAAPYPDDRWRMVANINSFVPEGGPHGLGYLEGSIDVDPSAWFFKAHFHQDPVWPGSLGLEALLQLMKFATNHRWGVDDRIEFQTMLKEHHWIYRGQVIPTNQRVRILAEITEWDDDREELTADGWLEVDGRLIYQMKNFTVRRMAGTL